jgi:glycosyltransferase involved in cell wall biosynthesis
MIRPPMPAPRVALAHDYLLVLRGAERTVVRIADLYRDAPIFTLLYDEAGTERYFAGRDITTSPLQHLGVGQSNFRRLLPLYPWAVGRLRVPPVDVLLSSSSAFAHGIAAPAGAVHVCYCHAPFRYAWYEEDRALAETPPPLRPALRLVLARMRSWDRRASARVTRYVANSKLTRERIRRYYGRDAEIVHPPVETSRFRTGTPGEEALIVSELVRHKRLDVALEGARRARVPVVVVGSGPERAALERAFPEAHFAGRASDEQLVELYASARALLVPSVEEFGIAAVEAQASGRPVIAAAAGGATETVIEGETGLLVTPDDPGAFAAAIGELDRLALDPARAVANAERFSVAAFQRGLAAQVQDALQSSRS